MPPDPIPPRPPDPARLADSLDHPNEWARVRAAQALFAAHDPRALEACLKTLDDGADPLHLDHTPAVFCLRAMGRPALAPLFAKLEAEDRMTRLHAQRAVEGITKREFGFDGVSNWEPGGLERWEKWWRGVGYRSDAPPKARRRAVARLDQWLRTLAPG
jgi:hypothetical protein